MGEQTRTAPTVMKERIEALVRQQMTLYGPERAHVMFDAFLGQSRN
ncbi:hypothetical protein [Streptomyces sp. CRB46]|nr:hypothetical protein [Streptomyces sp. CRB46]